MPKSELSLAALLADPKTTARRLDLADARGSLLDFCGLIDVPGAPVEADEDAESALFAPVRRPPAAHHRLLIEKLEAVERGDLRRLMVFMPPGSAKSTYASVVFPVWFLGRWPRRHVILATYASDLARKIGRRARSIARQRVFREIFDARLSGEAAAAEAWALDNGSEFLAGGVLAGLTGSRADLLIVDDPVKGRAEADSEQIRGRTRAEYEDTLKTRLKPGGRIVLIQTRWHEDDLAGSILPQGWDGESGRVRGRDGEAWEVLCLPAQAWRADDPLGRSPGEYLWPEWFSPDHWAAFRANARGWAALYQQRPQPEQGGFFQRPWFVRYRPDELPRRLRLYGSSDYAVSEDRGDFTVHRVWGVDAEGTLWLLACGWRGRTTADVWIEAQIDLMARFRPFAWFGEAGVIQKAIEPGLRRRMWERKTPCRLEWLASITDKPTRARGFQARAAMGRVRLPEGPEGDAVLDEWLRFPSGRHDDEVDCASLIGRALDEVHPAVVPAAAAVAAPRGVGEMTWNELIAAQKPRKRRV